MMASNSGISKMSQPPAVLAAAKLAASESFKKEWEWESAINMHCQEKYPDQCSTMRQGDKRVKICEHLDKKSEESTAWAKRREMMTLEQKNADGALCFRQKFEHNPDATAYLLQLTLETE